jgi:AcrR family transcriptional regulator
LNHLFVNLEPCHDETHERILNAAEKLFAQFGHDGTTLRDITKAASVNLAAVNYHFGTKQALYTEVFQRVIRPINERRLAILGQAEQLAGDHAVPLRAIADSFIRPVFEMARGRPPFLLLMSRNFSAPPAFMHEVMAREFGFVAQRYLRALKTTLPHLPPGEVFWRMFYVTGAMLFVAAHQQSIERLSQGLCRIDTQEETEASIRRLVDFAVAGISAPATGAA